MWSRSLLFHQSLAQPLALLACLALVNMDEVKAVDFESDVRPILNEHCVGCHGGVKQAGDVSFLNRESALAAIEPGDPDASTLVERITADDESIAMPPPEHGPPLTEAQVQTLVKWIEEGAEWKQPWAYEPPVAPEIPEVGKPQWPEGPLDRFVLQTIEREKLDYAKQAPPNQWLRRVTLDLVGIPPTPTELESFLTAVKRDGELAYVREVDRLLSLPGYGERWASVWLDQIRYADSRGLGLDGRRDMWKYRDWVIDALNEDMPYDEFTIKQLAGDLLPNPTVRDFVATAANRLTQTNQEGGTDDEEFRVAAVLDRVSTVWQTWQGITFGCVQCHSHPYDPILHDEFYKFAAFFNTTADCDLDQEWPVLAMPLDPKDEPLASELDAQIRELEREIWQREREITNQENAQWQGVPSLEATADKETKIKVVQSGANPEFLTTDTLSKGTTITLSAPLPKTLATLSAIQLTIKPRDPATAKADSEWGFVLSNLSGTITGSDGKSQNLEFERVVGDEPHPFFDPNESLKDNSNGFSAFSRIHYPRVATVVLKAPLTLPPDAKLELKLKHQVELLGAFPLISRRGEVAISDQPKLAEQLRESELQQLRQQLQAAKSARSKIPSVNTPVMVEQPEHLKRPTHVFIRGLFLTKDQEVTPDVPSSLPALPADAPKNRLALARWIASPQNPLTARVAVNRVWSQLFGTGLVVTEEDFGSSGQTPTHPELLDYLSVRFQTAQGWSFKALLRELVLSSTYRQDAAISPSQAAQDPSNRWLARGPRFRLPAEMVRDCAMATANLLSHRMHGRPVQPPIPAQVWRPFDGDRWETEKPGTANRYRRSIYTYAKRSIPYPMFAAFDAPSREFCNPRRLRSNTPIQALTMLNDESFVECIDALAKRMNEQPGELSEKIRFGFVTVATRQPDPIELQTLVELHNNYPAKENEKSSMFAVASVLLNMDEIMSK